MLLPRKSTIGSAVGISGLFGFLAGTGAGPFILTLAGVCAAQAITIAVVNEVKWRGTPSPPKA